MQNQLSSSGFSATYTSAGLGDVEKKKPVVGVAL